MQMIQVIIFLLYIIGLFLIFNITPKGFIESVIETYKEYKTGKKESLRDKIKKSLKEKNTNQIERFINETKEIMINNGTIKKFDKMIILSIVCGIIGIIIALLINNIFMLPVIAVLMALIPFFFIRLQNIYYKNQIKDELETALSNITSSYMRYNVTFLNAVKENIDNIKYPLKNSFKKYIIVTENINSNTKENLEELKKAINNDTYREWLDGVIASEEDNNLKATLPNIINKFTDMRIVNNELQTKIYAPLKDYIMMVLLTVLSMPLFFVFDKNMVISYLTLPAGKIEMTIIFIVIIYCSFKVSQILKPTEYKR